MTTTDTPKRLSDDEVAAQFLALEDFLSNVDGHDMTDWSTDESGEVRGTDEGTIDADDAYKAMNALKSHIAALTAPPSRARELLAGAILADDPSNGELSRMTRAGTGEQINPAIRVAIAAITQALTESSGQVTDGACCEAMREKAAVIAEDKSFEGFSISTAPDLESIATVREVEVREAIANSIRALPVSADGRAK